MIASLLLWLSLALAWRAHRTCLSANKEKAESAA